MERLRHAFPLVHPSRLGTFATVTVLLLYLRVSMVQKHPVRAHEHHVPTVLGAGEVLEHAAVPFPSSGGGRRPPRQRRRHPGLGQSFVGVKKGRDVRPTSFGSGGKGRDRRGWGRLKIFKMGSDAGHHPPILVVLTG